MIGACLFFGQHNFLLSTVGILWSVLTLWTCINWGFILTSLLIFFRLYVTFKMLKMVSDVALVSNGILGGYLNILNQDKVLGKYTSAHVSYFNRRCTGIRNYPLIFSPSFISNLNFNNSLIDVGEDSHRHSFSRNFVQLQSWASDSSTVPNMWKNAKWKWFSPPLCIPSLCCTAAQGRGRCLGVKGSYLHPRIGLRLSSWHFRLAFAKPLQGCFLNHWAKGHYF